MDAILDTLPALTQHELRVVEASTRARLEKKRDILASIAAEIQEDVIRWMAPQSIWPSLQVSRAWRRILLQHYATICRLHFPGLLQLTDAQVNENHRDHTIGYDAQQVEFLKASHRCSARHQLQYSSVMFQRPWIGPSLQEPQMSDQNIFSEGSVGTSPPCARWPADLNVTNWSTYPYYHHGRIAWGSPGTSSTVFAIDDLRLRTRNLYKIPARHRDLERHIRIAALGDTLLVGQNHYGARLAAWSIDAPKIFVTTRISDGIGCLATAGKIVAGTYSRDLCSDASPTVGTSRSNWLCLWEWTVGGKTIDMKIAEPIAILEELMLFRKMQTTKHGLVIKPHLLHSRLAKQTTKRTFYLFIAGRRTPGQDLGAYVQTCLQLSVFEISNGRFSGRWSVDLPSSWRPSDGLSQGCLNPIDSYGTYAMATNLQKGPRQGSLYDELMTFNIWSKTFGKQTYVIMDVQDRYGSTGPIWEKHVWDSQLVYWIPPDARQSPSTFDLLPLVTTSLVPDPSLPPEPKRSLSEIRVRRIDHPSQPPKSLDLGSVLDAKNPLLDLSKPEPPTCLEWDAHKHAVKAAKETRARLESCSFENALDYGVDFHSNARPHVVAPTILGDDEFLVFISWCGYTAWRFPG